MSALEMELLAALKLASQATWRLGDSGSTEVGTSCCVKVVQTVTGGVVESSSAGEGASGCVGVAHFTGSAGFGASGGIELVYSVSAGVEYPDRAEVYASGGVEVRWHLRADKQSLSLPRKWHAWRICWKTKESITGRTNRACLEKQSAVVMAET